MENPYEVEMKQRRKVLIATIVMAAIVLGLLVWVIVAAVTQPSSTDDTQPIVATEESIPENAGGTTSETVVSGTATDNQESSTAVSTVSGTSSTSSTSSASSLPATGPADLALTALLAGVATYLAVRYFDSRRSLSSLPAEK